MKIPSTPLRNALLTLGVLALFSLFLPELPIWITDNGNKYIVMRNQAQYGTAEIRHPEPEFFPDGGFHFVKHRGSIRSFHSEYYPKLLSYVVRPFGERAAMWMSMLGTALAVWLTGVAMDRKTRGMSWALALATPMFFFSFLLWEMTWSVCFAVAALALLQRKHALAAGAVIGAGAVVTRSVPPLSVAIGTPARIKSR